MASPRFLQQHRGAVLGIATAVLLSACGAAGGVDVASSPAPQPRPTAPAPAAPHTPASPAPPEATADDKPASAPAPAVSPAPSATPRGQQPPPAEGVPAGEGLAPVRISIPAIDVDAEVIDLGLNADGTMEVPDDFSVTGWFRHGANPGEQGPSVIAGHVDSKAGPAVFYRLGELDAGHQVEVADAQGRTVTYEVQRVGQYSKEAFPTDKVYAFTEEPTLRLVTCGGPFNETIGHYEHNVIVFARRVA